MKIRTQNYLLPSSTRSGGDQKGQTHGSGAVPMDESMPPGGRPAAGTRLAEVMGDLRQAKRAVELRGRG